MTDTREDRIASFDGWVVNEDLPLNMAKAEDEFGDEYYTDIGTRLCFTSYAAGYHHAEIDAAWRKP